MSEDDVTMCVRLGEGGFEGELVMGADAPIKYVFEFDRGASAIQQALRNLEEGFATTDDLKYIGAELWDALLPGDCSRWVRERITKREHTNLWLALPSELDDLPWESLYDTTLRFVGCHLKVSLLHGQRHTERTQPQTAERISILVVIPCGSGLDVDTEWANLRASVAKLGDSVRLEVLRGDVTPDRLCDTLLTSHWHVVHFIGHGRLKDNYVEIRMNDERGGECWRTAEEFASIFQGAAVDVCVLNCCHGGSATDIRTTDRMAPALLDAGVRSVVAMRYAMADTDANRFSQAFYHHLVRGARSGYVGYAVQMGRKSLFQNAARDDGRSFITPLAHIAEPGDRFFDFATASRGQTAETRGSPATIPDIVPAELAEAIRQRRCIPVVGPELIPPPAQRHGTAPPGLRGLIERLTQTFVPFDSTPSAAADPPQSAVDEQLSRLAERFEAASKWPHLLQAVRDYYAPLQPSPLHRAVARWSAPGIFYTHFDGLMEAAFAAEGHAYMVQRLSESAEPTKSTPALRGGSDASESTLVLVRGTVSDLRSVVLSEHDHFALDESIDRISPSLQSLTTSCLGRCVVFLGTTPGDHITRKLARKLLEANNPRATQSFFVSSNHSASDELFWRRFQVTFIRQDTEAFIRALSAVQESA